MNPILLVGLLCLLSPLSVFAGDAATDPAGEAFGLKIGSDKKLVLFPKSDLYPSYTADPRRPKTGLSRMYLIRRAIPQTSLRWLETSVGGTIGLLRIHPDGKPERGFQLQGVGGIFAQWDDLKGQDGIGWDGIIGFRGVWKPGERAAFQFGNRHKSSHITDEYVAKSGRARINYTRNEFLAGISYLLAPRWRAYGEAGAAYSLLSPLQEIWRFQWGIEYESEPIFWNGLAAGFLAADFQSDEENSWNVSSSAHAGLVLHARHSNRKLRLGVEYYYGRSPLGDFFQYEVSHIAIAFWLGF